MTAADASIDLTAPLRPHRLWWSQARWPLLGFMLLAVPFALTRWDLAIAHALYFDPANGWRGAHTLLAGPILHDGGRWAIRGIMLLSILAWLLSYVAARLVPG